MRIFTLGSGQLEKNEGPPQGIFATEYADEKTNFLCQTLLVWLIMKTKNSKYSSQNIDHIEAILTDEKILDLSALTKKGIIQENYTSCPLCKKIIEYEQLHKMLELDDEDGRANAAEQVSESTRSTEVNLFHMKPLLYSSLEHTPVNICWGHAVCNTKLGQIECIPVDTLISTGDEIKINNNESLGWLSKDKKMIRSSNGDTWIKISNGS
ncbi:MAG: BstXI family restriction endonuclease [Candidatus Nitrosotenuis sp.]|nr:MAG: BstXI family restriction endonuclease [Candidatus Nitrosotenuis sp.]